ncbi:helix-turn-helix domain-containing protein, partial [Actinomadura luteofluorescens]
MAETARPLAPPDDRPADETPRDPAAEPLWRDALGQCLRRLRLERGEILVETARRAGVSPQYLSEMERGVKEPSSEMIAAVAGALDGGLGQRQVERRIGHGLGVGEPHAGILERVPL